VSILAKRASMAALTVIGLVLLVLGLWFTSHLGSSGSATFRAAPKGGVVVLEPSVLNRVNQPTTVTAVAGKDTKLWMGLASPSDAHDIVGAAERTEVTGARLRTWSLETTHVGAGPAPDLAVSDIWHTSRTGTGTVHLGVDQADAPESMVIAGEGGSPVDLTSLTVTVQRQTWFAQALLTALVGLLATIAGVVGLWQQWRHPREGASVHPDVATEEVRA
jgi:hypothetical protein